MSLHALEMLLGSLPPARMTPEDLRALATAWPGELDQPGLAALARFSDQGYTRTMLHRSAGWEALVVGWLPGSAPRPTDMARASGSAASSRGRSPRWSTGSHAGDR
jgi:hypothetical protein